jgi:hypothetical protein
MGAAEAKSGVMVMVLGMVLVLVAPAVNLLECADQQTLWVTQPNSKEQVVVGMRVQVVLVPVQVVLVLGQVHPHRSVELSNRHHTLYGARFEARNMCSI